MIILVYLKSEATPNTIAVQGGTLEISGIAEACCLVIAFTDDKGNSAHHHIPITNVLRWETRTEE